MWYGVRNNALLGQYEANILAVFLLQWKIIKNKVFAHKRTFTGERRQKEMWPYHFLYIKVGDFPNEAEKSVCAPNGRGREKKKMNSEPMKHSRGMHIQKKTVGYLMSNTVSVW